MQQYARIFAVYRPQETVLLHTCQPKKFLCGTYCRVLRDATQNLRDVFRGEKIHAQKAPAHVVNTFA